ncbi:MAG: universal stress protein [Pirellulales bacterium]
MVWLPKQSVVVPVDFSDKSFDAVAAALELVKDASHLHVVHVLPSLEPAEPGVIWSTIDDPSRARHAEQAIHERLEEHGLKQAQVAIAFGDPGREIAEYAQKASAELIVLPSHGRTGITRMLIGSVAERVVRLAHCPVLVLRD